jgi:hypothetical protein
MYKPQYLNVVRITDEYGFNDSDESTTILVSVEKLGYKKKPPEKLNSKSGRHFK